jgi:hypothetical protein
MLGGVNVADDTVAVFTTAVRSDNVLTPVSGSGVLVTGANTGTCRLRFAPETANSSVLKANSVMRVHKV